MSGSPVSASPQLFLGGSSPGEILVRGGNCSRFCCHSTQSRGPRLTWGKGLGGHPPPPPGPQEGLSLSQWEAWGISGLPSIHPSIPSHQGLCPDPLPTSLGFHTAGDWGGAGGGTWGGGGIPSVPSRIRKKTGPTPGGWGRIKGRDEDGVWDSKMRPKRFCRGSPLGKNVWLPAKGGGGGKKRSPARADPQSCRCCCRSQ